MQTGKLEFIAEDGHVFFMASAWKRMVAAAINFGLAYLIWDITLYFFPVSDLPTINLAVLAAYGFLQILLMSVKGQSIGKRIMGIKVIDKNGSNPGFLGTVLAREVLFLGLLIFFKIVGALPYLICLVMLFVPKFKRRTLQDKLMGSVVVDVSSPVQV